MGWRLCLDVNISCQHHSDYYLFGKMDLNTSLGLSPNSFISLNLVSPDKMFQSSYMLKDLVHLPTLIVR